MTGLFPLDLLLFALVVLAPGTAIAALWVPPAERLALLAVGLTVGLFGTPMLAYTAAILLGTHVSPGLCLAVSAAVTVVALTAARWRRAPGLAPRGP